MKQMTLISKILSNPNYEPPENLLELNLNNDLKGLLESPGVSHEILVRFAVFEAELTLPIFEAQHPGDSRPRDAIQTTRDWFSNPAAAVAAVADAARAASAVAASYWGCEVQVDATAYAAAWAVAAAARAAYAASDAARAYAAADVRATAASAASAAKAAYWARVADPRVTEEAQIKRFLDLFHITPRA